MGDCASDRQAERRALIQVHDMLRRIHSLPAGAARDDALQILLSSSALLQLARPGSPLWPSLLALMEAGDLRSK